MRARCEGTPTPGPGLWANRREGAWVGSALAAAAGSRALCIGSGARQGGPGASLARGRARFESGVSGLVIFGCGFVVVTDFVFSIWEARMYHPLRFGKRLVMKV